MSARSQLVGFWHAHSARERAAIALGLGAVAVLVCYTVLWRPMQRDLARMDEQLPRLRAQVVQIARAGEEIDRLRAKAPVGTTNPAEAASLVSRSAATYGMQGRIALADKAGSRISASFENVSLHAWIGWVDELHRNHRLVLVAAKLSAISPSGTIRAEAELAPAAAVK